MKVAFLIRSLTFGGAERQLILSAVALKERGIDVSVLVYYPGPLDDEARQLGLRLVHIQRKGRWDVLPFTARLIAAIDAVAPDVLYSYLPVANLFGALVKLLRHRIKLVWGIRASTLEVSQYPIAVRLSLWLERAVHWLPDAVVANSQSGLRTLGKIRGEHRTVIANAVDAKIFFPSEDARAATRAALGVADGEPLIGMVARLDPMKDHGTFLNAAKRIRDVRPNARFVCAGRGDTSDRGMLEVLATQYGINDLIVLDGATKLNGLYNALDLLVLSSAFGESMPNVVLEAMACGTPAVVTDVGAAGEVVGRADRVVPPRDPEALANACLACLNGMAADPTAERQRLRHLAIEKYSVDKLAADTLQVMYKVAALRVTVVVGSLKLGGCEQHLSVVLPALQQRGFDITIYALTERGVLADMIEAKGIRIVGALGRAPRFVRLPRSLRGLLVLGNLAWRTLHRPPDIIHCFLPDACIVGGLVGKLCHIRNVVMSRRSLRNYQVASKFLARLEQAVMRRSRAVLGNSRAVITQLREEKIDSDRLGLLYSGMDLSDSTPSSSDLRAQEGVANDALLLGIVANLHPYKGHLPLIEALASIAGQLPSGWSLFCIGQDAGFQPELERNVARLGLQHAVRFLGARENAAQYWRMMDIGLLVSTQEGFSMALLEGMAAGVPMIVTDVGGNAEAVIDGRCGRVVPLNDIAALAEAILAYARSPELRHRHGASAARRVHDTFSLESCVSGYERLYRGLISRHGGTIQSMIDGGDGR